MTATEPKLIHGQAFGKALIAAGVLPAKNSIRRVVIDVPCDGPVTVYVESAGDERLLSVVQTLSGVEIHGVPKDEPPAEVVVS